MSAACTSPDLPALLNYLYALQRRGIKPGLTPTRELLQACGNPHQDYPALHVAGTNGKGSTAAMLASILRAAGYKVGLYTSPHLVRFNERIRVNGVPIGDSDIADFVHRYRPEFERLESTFFEATTALALWYFARQKVAVAVVETGLGGRLDSTNILNPAVTVITAIGIDHTALLGRDINSIAAEKAGIIKPGVVVVIAPQEPPVRELLQRVAEARGAPVCQLSALPDGIRTDPESGTSFRYRKVRYRVPLLGSHQAGNAVCALEAVRHFNPHLPRGVLVQGLETVSWPGRLQRLRRRPPVYYDVAHNAQGVAVVLDTIRSLYGLKPAAVLAVKSDKELSRLAPVIQAGCSRLWVTGGVHADLMPAAVLARELRILGVRCQVRSSCRTALAELAGRAETLTPGLVFGSHYIAAEVYEYFGFSFESGII